MLIFVLENYGGYDEESIINGKKNLSRGFNFLVFFDPLGLFLDGGKVSPPSCQETREATSDEVIHCRYAWGELIDLSRRRSAISTRITIPGQHRTSTESQSLTLPNLPHNKWRILGSFSFSNNGTRKNILENLFCSLSVSLDDNPLLVVRIVKSVPRWYSFYAPNKFLLVAWRFKGDVSVFVVVSPGYFVAFHSHMITKELGFVKRLDAVVLQN